MTVTRQESLPLLWTHRGAAVVPTQPTPPDSGDLERWVARVCAGIAEVASGERPAQNLFRVCSPAVVNRLRVIAAGPRPADRVRRVTSVRVTHTGPATVEACAVVSRGRRSQAVAVQLRRRHGRWLVTAAEIR